MIPAPRPADEIELAPAPPRSVRSLAEVDDDLAMLEVVERRHREALAGTRRALADCAVRRELLLDQRRRSVAVAVEQLAAGEFEHLTAAG